MTRSSAWQTRASHKAGLLRAVSKSLRTGLQVAIYAVGAYLTVMHESSAGVMIAASIVMGRALAPSTRPWPPTSNRLTPAVPTTI